MNEAERQCVRLVLELKDDAQLHAVAKLATAEQLHQFALNYNPNDSVRPCLEIARHSICDAGTGLYLYWQFSDLLFQPALRLESAANEPRWNLAAILDLLEQRFCAGFSSADIYFNPQESWPLNSVQRRALIQNGIIPRMFEPIGALRVEKEWLLS